MCNVHVFVLQATTVISELFSDEKYTVCVCVVIENRHEILFIFGKFVFHFFWLNMCATCEDLRIIWAQNCKQQFRLVHQQRLRSIDPLLCPKQEHQDRIQYAVSPIY